MRKAVIGLLAGVLTTAVVAQDVPLQRAEERRATRQQSQEVYDAIQPAVQAVSGSTVWVWANRRQVAMGTVVGQGDKVLTKWSEIAFSRTPVQVVGGDGRTATATVLGVYQDDDVALLQLEGARFTPVQWSDQPSPKLGRFLIAAGADGSALNIGVVAVEERPLRDSDQAFIGITLDPSYEGEGIRVLDTAEGGGAAKAGLRRGDVVLKIDGKGVSSPFELRNALLDFSPGDEAAITFIRDGSESKVSVELTGRPEFPGVPEGRLRTMRQMGGPISLVGRGFPTAIQTDMQLKPHQCGGPVVDLNGEVVGMSISRTDRTRSFILPASRIDQILNEDPMDPTLAQLPRQASRPQARAGRGGAVPMNPRAAGRLRRHLEEMSRFLDRLDRETSRIGE
ncbi:PDZ domain-containing protein [Haloferula sp. A504]|uniref:PDZ domain-containing protein n=1 Tax=Haloferula sp. A504 TaxID=3373601 RepID=UPI0031BCE8A5|nr:PDZ domain-containing protein [Verrucomicrobiaceae bacterium E54]